MDRLFHKLEDKFERGLHEIFHRDEERPHDEGRHDDEDGGHEFSQQIQEQDEGRIHHRYKSFQPPTNGGVKWHVDGAAYFWAVSVALEGKPRVPT